MSARYKSLVFVLSEGDGARYVYLAGDAVTEPKIEQCPLTGVGTAGLQRGRGRLLLLKPGSGTKSFSSSEELKTCFNARHSNVHRFLTPWPVPSVS